MNIIDIINKTKHSVPLTDGEITWLVENYTNGEIPDYQMSAWLMAVCINGLTEEETVSLTLAMRDSGEKLDLSGIGNFRSQNVGQRSRSYGRNYRQTRKHKRLQDRTLAERIFQYRETDRIFNHIPEQKPLSCGQENICSQKFKLYG